MATKVSTRYNPSDNIQIRVYEMQPDSRAEHVTGGAEQDDAEIMIEVFDNDRANVNIFNVPRAECERVLLADTKGDIEMARRFAELISRESHARNMFRAPDNLELLIRQIITIGQDDQLFPSRIIIPTLHVAPGEPDVIARIRATNAQQVLRGKVIRTRVRAKVRATNALDARITDGDKVVSTTATDKATAILQRQNDTRMHARILCYSSFGSNPVIYSTSNDIAYIIDAIDIVSLRKYPFARVRDYTAVIPPPFNIAIPRNLDATGSSQRTIIDEKTDEAQMMAIFAHLRCLHYQFESARPYIISDFESRDILQDITQSWRETDIEVIPPQMAEHATIVNKIARIFGVSPNFATTTNISRDFMIRDALPIYIAFLIGENQEQILSAASQSERAVDAMNASKVEFANNRAQLSILMQVIKEFAPKSRAYRELIAPAIHFGLREKSARSSSVTKDELFRALTAAEQKLIHARFDAIIRQSSGTSNCAHVAAMAKLREAASIFAISRALDNIEPFLPSKKSSARDLDTHAIIKCSRCNEALICPHLLTQLRAVVARNQSSQIRIALAPFVEAIDFRRLSYCKICGEIFDNSIVIYGDIEQAETENEELSDIIFHELIVAQRYFRAKHVIDTSTFLRAMSRHIYPFIEAIYNRLTIMQTSTVSELGAKTRIFAAIYIFADCIVNAQKLHIVFDGISNDASLPHLIKYAVDKIISITNVALAVVPGFTREVINTNIITAITQLRKVANIMPSEAPRDYRATLQYDPVFALICYASRGKGRKIYRDPMEFRDDIFTILGEELNAENMYKELFARTIIASRQSRLAQIIANLREMYDLREYAHPISADERARIPPNVIKLRENIAAQRAKIHAKEIARIAPTLIHHINYSRPSSARFNTNIIAPLDAVYDENGLLHVWSIVIIEKNADASEGKRGSRKTEGTTVREELPISTPGIFVGTKVIAYKCAICGATTADKRVAPDKLRAIARAIEARDHIGNFYQFYETRCPVKGVHEWKSSRSEDGAESMSCAKCHMSRELLRNTSLESQRLAFYEKFAAQFNRVMARNVVRRESIAEQQVDKGRARITEHVVECEKSRDTWIFDFDAVIRTATEFKVDRRDIIMLGAKEGITAEQLHDESYIALVPRARDDPRIRYIRARIIDIIIYYRIFRGLSNREKTRMRSALILIEKTRKAYGPATFDRELPSLEPLEEIVAQNDAISSLICAGDFAPTDGKGLAINMLYIFNAAITHFANTHKPAQLVEFYLEVFCKLLLAINSRGTIHAAFARSVLAYIIEIDNLSLKHEHYNAIITEGTKLISEQAMHYSDEIDDDEAEVDEDVQQDTREDDEEDSRLNPFSLDAFDMDIDTLDEDDGSPTIRMGDEIGW